MSWDTRLIDYDPVLRRQELFHSNKDGDVALETRWDIEPIIESNKARYAAIDERAGFKGDGLHRIGQVPMSIYKDWKKKTSNFKDQDAFARLVNDKNNRYFLVRPVKL
jgi:hypothetical protein|tara:strand:- start:1508 stop:1831 length:324 start_codon:yes stop_codon:yes gene_type:complete